MELLNSSIDIAKNSVFNDKNRIVREFKTFELQLRKHFSFSSNISALNNGSNPKDRQFNLYGFTSSVFTYINDKYKREMNKL